MLVHSITYEVMFLEKPIPTPTTLQAIFSRSLHIMGSYTNELSVYGKGAKWGLYTQHSIDALATATILGLGLLPEYDDATVGTYAHYPPPMKGCC